MLADPRTFAIAISRPLSAAQTTFIATTLQGLHPTQLLTRPTKIETSYLFVGSDASPSVTAQNHFRERVVQHRIVKRMPHLSPTERASWREWLHVRSTTTATFMGCDPTPPTNLLHGDIISIMAEALHILYTQKRSRKRKALAEVNNGCAKRPKTITRHTFGK